MPTVIRIDVGSQSVASGGRTQGWAAVQGVSQGERFDRAAVAGGARSPLWLRIKADITVRSVLSDCPTSMGAAMPAGVAAGMFSGLTEAAQACVPSCRSDTRPTKSAIRSTRPTSTALSGP